MNTIVHFEIPADDPERAIQFYQALFGWKIEKTESDMGYWMIQSTNEKGEPGISGGLLQRQQPHQQITNYVAVPSIEEYAEKIESLGGSIDIPKTAAPGFGYFAVCLDTENNAFAIWFTTHRRRNPRLQ